MANLELGDFLRIPRGTPNTHPLEFDLKDIEKIELRKSEIAFANKETAPELMQTFNKAYCAVTRMMAQISYEYAQAKKYAEKRKSVVVLDIAPSELNRRNLRSSEDLRLAVLNIDEEYLGLTDKVDMLEAVYEFLRGKAKGFEMAYHSSKKILDGYGTALGSVHSVLTHGIEESPDLEATIGNPKY